jgi:hypothetical protein
MKTTLHLTFSVCVLVISLLMYIHAIFLYYVLSTIAQSSMRCLSSNNTPFSSGSVKSKLYNDTDTKVPFGHSPRNPDSHRMNHHPLVRELSAESMPSTSPRPDSQPIITPRKLQPLGESVGALTPRKRDKLKKSKSVKLNIDDGNENVSAESSGHFSPNTGIDAIISPRKSILKKEASQPEVIKPPAQAVAPLQGVRKQFQRQLSKMASW